MATLTFDKLAYVDRLQAAGMGEREARALAEGLDQALREEVATKSDIAPVTTDIAAVKTDLSAVKTELSVEIAAVNTRLTTVEHKLQVDIQTAKHDVLRWMVGMALTGLTVALIRLLPH